MISFGDMFFPLKVTNVICGIIRDMLLVDNHSCWLYYWFMFQRNSPYQDVLQQNHLSEPMGIVLRRRNLLFHDAESPSSVHPLKSG